MDDDFKGTPNPLNPLVRNPLAEELEVEEPKAEEKKPEKPEKVEEAETPDEKEKSESPIEAKELETPKEPKDSNPQPKPNTPTRMRRIEDFEPTNSSSTPELVDDFAPLTADDFEPVEPMHPVQAPRPAAPLPPAKSARPAQMMRPGQSVQSMQMTQDIQSPRPMNTQPMRPAPAPRPVPMQQSTPMSSPTPQSQPILDTNLIQQIGVVTNLDGTRPMDSLDPTNRPMKKAAEVIEKPQKKKTGLIAGIIISVLVAATCITVAILIVVKLNRPDPMTAAVEKIMQQGLPEKVAIDGNININIYNKALGVSKINIDFDSQMAPSSLMNATNATMNLILRDGGEVSMNADEIYAANGDLYIKTKNLANVMDVLIPDEVTIDGDDSVEVEEGAEEMPAENAMEEDIEFEKKMTDSLETLEQVTGAIEVLDDEWIRITTDDFDSLVSATTEKGDATICTARMMIDALKTRNTIAGAYLSNQFIASTDKDIPIENNNYQVQRLAIDGEKFTNFIDGSSGSLSAVGNYLDCLGYDKTALNADSLMEKLAQGPAIYAEIDGDNNFTRFYLIGNIGDEDNLEGQITADINITYPDNVNISEPTEYTDSSEVLQNVLQTIKEKNAS